MAADVVATETKTQLSQRDERLLWMIFILDTIHAALLVPLLPHYVRLAHLSTLMAGVLTSAFAAGVLAGAVPGAMLAARVSARTAIVAGLLTGAAASLVFGFATGAPELFAARFGQGVGSGIVWTGSLTWLVGNTASGQRGEAIGRALGAAVVGQLLGPACGALGAIWGTQLVFSAIAFVGLVLALRILCVAASVADKASAMSWRPVARSLTDRRVSRAVWLVALPALLIGALAVIAPLRLGALGASAAVIATMWLLSGGIEAGLSSRIGRSCDRRGVRPPLRAALLLAAGSCLLIPYINQRWVLSAVVMLGAVAYGCMWVPAMTNLTHAADQAQLHPGVGLALQSAWAPAQVIGTAVLGGALTQVAGPKQPFLILAALCLATYAGARRLVVEPHSNEEVTP